MACAPDKTRGGGKSPIRAWRAADHDRGPALATSERLARTAFGKDLAHPLAILTRAIRKERVSAATGRAGYDVARHVALVRALRGLAKRQGAPRR